MRNCKIATLGLLLLFNVLSNLCFAQSEPKKDVVIVDLFTRTNVVSSSIAETARQNVIAGFAEKGRFTLIDAETDATLKKLNAERPKEDVVDESNILNQDKEQAYKSLGARYLITGSSTNYSSTSSTVNGKKVYKSVLDLSLKVFDINTGEVVAAEIIKGDSGYTSYPTQKEADASALTSIKASMASFVSQYFKFETSILELGDADKKGRVKEAYINGGSGIGVQKGTVFLVYKTKKIGTKIIKTQIGKLVASEIDTDVTKCRVVDGEEEIKALFNNGVSLIVISDKDRFQLF